MAGEFTSLAADGGPTEVDELVARYAPLGRRLRQRRRRARIGMSVLAATAALALLAGWQSRDQIAAQLLRPSPAAARIEQALAQASRDRADLARRLAAVTRDRDELAAREAGLQQRQAELDARLQKAELERHELLAASGDQAGVKRERAEVARQRDALEQQRQRFVEQGQALTRELGDIRQQRADIERQRKAIEAQQAEVRRLLDRAREVGAAPRQAPAQAAAEPAPEAPLERLAAVDAGTLGEVRGGMDLGGGYNIAIGITRTASINGVEQFTSTLQVDNLAALAGAGVPAGALDPVVIQNGPGNLVSSGTLEALSPAVTTLIQNSLDNQHIASRTVMDISLQDVNSVARGLQLSRTVGESLALRP